MAQLCQLRWNVRRYVSGAFGVLIALFVLSAGQPAVAGGSNGEDAQKFVATMAQEAIDTLTAGNQTHNDRVAHFRAILDRNFDVPFIAQWVLGRYWRGIGTSEREEYLKLFENLIVVTYVDRFEQYSGEVLKVGKSLTDSNGDTIVYSEIARPQSGTPVRVDWRVRKIEGAYKIIDVVVEGVSMGQTQRSEFASVIRQNGGQVAGLLKVLRQKVSGSS
ncbi:phospholipid transport system substrate-binding protein [Varunaivibrio sulfuroxidans]|uniref:Phospholipid transport system substrate-binding protein n=2 Tax=Varunaivibrio sulfuroxidans TaxID=1773489 RepID=A0A4R3J8V3_9PROT|nr:phospholipid transport system substrate-binding protein [Varunaivibrio sulfuroxidans]